jgi:hypothetical protein
VEGVKVQLTQRHAGAHDAFVGTYRRSKFMRAAVGKELRRLEKKAAKKSE